MQISYFFYTNMENILEKIIKEEKTEEINRLDAINIVDSLFSKLMDREKDVLSRRFGLKGERGETLEKIGKLHKLTRERVRQIESASIKKIKKLDKLEDYIGGLKEAVYKLLEDHGGLIRRDYLLDILTVLALDLGAVKNDKEKDGYDEKVRQSYKNHFDFLLSKMMGEDLEIIKKSDKFTHSFKMKQNEISHLEELADNLMDKVKTLKKTLSTEELIELLKQLDTYNRYQDKFQSEDLDIETIFKSQKFLDKAETINRNKVLYSLMQAVKQLDRNKYGQWGMSDWNEIKPKTVNDKIYLVLKNEGKPMHFTAIADKINEVKFDNKKANAATVHNELILDDRYVLVSRGTYALKNW